MEKHQLQNLKFVAGKLMHVAASDNNPEDRNNFNQNVNTAAQNYNAAQLKKRTRVQKLAADKVQLYERLS